MKNDEGANGQALLKVLTFLMFLMFAMTTDSVGVVIPEIIKQFSLGMTAAGSFQYATMSGISIAAIGLGFLADRIGRKWSIVVGLTMFGGACGLFAVGDDFGVFVLLLFVSGVGIGIFKAGALALIGDLSRSTREHTSTMNMVEGFFGVGAIIGPAIVAYLLHVGAPWKWLYVIAAGLCVLLILGAATARYPAPRVEGPPSSLAQSLKLMKDPFALGFGLAMMLYVAAEAAVYVWAPTYLAGYDGPVAWFALYAVSIFFVLRAAGRFVGAWLLERHHWTVVLAICCCGTALCFLGAALLGRGAAALLLPASGVFMSVVYPTLNSKGISCFGKGTHGAAAGLLLFFTCVSAVLAPLAMAGLSDAMGDAKYSLHLATGFAVLLGVIAVANALWNPARQRLSERDAEDYAARPEAASPRASQRGW
jgi:fucose permease